MTYLSDHLTVEEVHAASSWPLSNEAAANIPNLAAQFEALRSAGGGFPIVLSSFFRSQLHNAVVGGARLSDHLKGEAWDGTPEGVDVTTWARNAIASIRSGYTPAIGQMIIYPYSDGHVHVSFAGARGIVNQYLVEVAKSGSNRYAVWDGVSDLPAWIGQGSPGASSDAGLPTDEGSAGSLSVYFLAFVAVGLWVLFHLGGTE